MAIAFACEGCGKAYEVPDSLAGKRGRCKACGHEFRIPAAGMAPSDVYGMDEDDDAPLSRSSSPASVGGSASSGSPRMKRFAPLSDDAVGTTPIARSKAKPVDAENQAQFRNVGIWLMIAGVGAFVLPLIGLQIKGLHRLPPQAQQGGGVLFLMLGAMVLGVSYTRRPMRSVGFGCAGIAGLAAVGLLLIFVMSGFKRAPEPVPPPIVVNLEREGVRAPRIPRPPFGEGVPRIPPNVPAANPAASGYPPEALQPFGPGSSPAPKPPQTASSTPVRPAAPKAPNSPSLPPPGEVEPGMLVALRAARGLQTPAPEFAPRIVAVTAEFRLQGEWPRENVQLVVEASGWNTSRTVFRPREVSGSVEARVVIEPGVKGPFHCYLGKRDNARGPNAYAPISNTVDLTIEDDPRFGGMPRGPQFGPSGPPPGFPGRPGRPGPPE